MRLRGTISNLGWSGLALIAVVAAFAIPVQGGGSSQNSHYALVRALANGTPSIDRTQYEVGDRNTSDLARRNGHWYSDKAPGLAFVTLPAYLGLKALGAPTTGDPANMLWALGLVGVVLPAAGLLLLVRRLSDRLAPGYGVATAVTLGLATPLLVFATVFFSHLLSAFLVFAAFALLWFERERTPHLGLVAAAGLLAGFSVTTEYPNGIAAIVLGALACTRAEPVKRALVYAGGVLAGVVPLLLYDWWAFGSPFRISRSYAVIPKGDTSYVPVDRGVLGFDTPSFDAGFGLLFSKWGLFTTTPVLIAGLAGAVLLYRRGRRAEAAVIAAFPFLYVLYSSAYYDPIGSLTWPRFLLPAVPFLGLGIALAFRARPVATAVLTVPSLLLMVAATATHPLQVGDGEVIDRLTSSGLEGYSQTVADLIGLTGWYDVVPFFAAVALAVLAAVRVTSLRPRSRLEFVGAAVALAAALIVATQMPPKGIILSLVLLGVVAVVVSGRGKLQVVERAGVDRPVAKAP